MNWIIDAVIVVVLLAFLIIGVAKGGVNTILSFASGIVILVACFFLTGPVGTAVCKGELDEKLATSIESGLNLDNSDAKLVYTQTEPKELVFINPDGEVSLLSEYLQSKTAFSKLTGSITRVAADTLDKSGEVTIGFVIALIIAQLIIKVAVFILLYIVFKIIFSVLKKLWKKARNKGAAIKKVDRIFGAVLGIVFAYCVISMIFAVLSFIFDFGLLSDIAMKIENTYVAKFLMQNNLFNILITKLWIK